LRAFLTMDKKEWERLCKQCGKCCHRLVETDGKFIRHPLLHCKFFNVDTKHCTVYHSRFMVHSSCMELIPPTIGELAESGFLPLDCGYVEEYLKIKGS
jgi:uncharacterized cysteine cluster protein YcgN (CxxCxxCC family)